MIEDQSYAGQRMLAGRYVLRAELGRGGMGVVWRGEDTVIGRSVAIKELRLLDGGEHAEVFQERVLREVRTGGRLTDPAVVTVFDVITEAQSTYIVMELVEAPTLSDLVAERGPLGPDLVAAIGEQVLSALTAAHQAGIVHRDVKPSNIMVAADGRVKLTDFGIAQAVDDPRLTTSGSLVGSPAFMAPERVAGQPATPASDLWSLGVTLFFAAEATLAFERGSTAATLHAIMNEVPYLSRTQGPLASAIMGMLITAQDARFGPVQVRQLLAAARTTTDTATPTAVHQASTSKTTRPVSVPSPLRRLAPRVGAAVVAVVLLVLGFLAGDWWASPPNTNMLETLTYGEGGDIPSLGDPSVGYEPCLNAPVRQDTAIASSNWVKCEEPHEAEIYDYATALGGDNSDEARPLAAPDDADLTRFAEARCALSFRSGTLRDQRPDDLRFRALIPARAEWERTPEGEPVRTVYCVVSRAGGQLDDQLRVEVK